MSLGKKWPRPSLGWKEVMKGFVTAGGTWNRCLRFSSPAFAYERGVNGEIKPRDKGLPWGLGCPLSHSPLAMFFSLLRQLSWVTNWELSKTDLGRTFRQHIGALLTGRTSWRKNVLARKFSLVLGMGPGAGRWNKIGCCRWGSTQEEKRWQG